MESILRIFQDQEDISAIKMPIHDLLLMYLSHNASRKQKFIDMMLLYQSLMDTEWAYLP